MDRLRERVAGQPPSYLVIAEGTLDWAAGANIRSATTPALTFQVGDALVVTGPASFDASASDLQSALLGDVVQ